MPCLFTHYTAYSAAIQPRTKFRISSSDNLSSLQYTLSSFTVIMSGSGGTVFEKNLRESVACLIPVSFMILSLDTSNSSILFLTRRAKALFLLVSSSSNPLANLIHLLIHNPRPLYGTQEHMHVIRSCAAEPLMKKI